ncbi:MAG: diacylglycerol kinase family lipid kinase [Candidatus Sericytochromatia bacterium]|nr:diacylglycerol kinase family lipid kinase [Candidatus Sericytochromatia bacterium]
MSKRALLVFNPSAGQLWNPFRANEVVTYLAGFGWTVDPAPTACARDAERLARRAVSEGYDLVIGAGGDGTLNELTQGLAGTPVPLAILPGGTTNVLARELGLPLSINGALELIPRGRAKPIDLGIANGRYFLFVCGLGFDATVTQSTDKKFKRWAGFWSLFVATFQNVVTHRPFALRIQIRDQHGNEQQLKRLAHQVMISNTETYGTGFKVATGAKFDDGVLELLIIRGRSMWEFFWRTARILLWPFSNNKLDLEHFPVTNLYVRSRRPVPVQLDGDAHGTTPVEIGIRPMALNMWVPENWSHPAAK